MWFLFLSPQSDAKNNTGDLSDLVDKMAKVKMEFKKSKDSETRMAASMEDELANAKHDNLRLRAELERMKQMLTTKDEQIKELRNRLHKYEPDT